MENIERLLREDQIEKKKAGRGVFARASRKKGIKGSAKFNYEYLNTKEKKEYTKASELKMGIITFDEFKQLSNEEKAKVLPSLLREYPRPQLRKMWGTNHAAMSYYCKKFIDGKEEKEQTNDGTKWLGGKREVGKSLENTKFTVAIKGEFPGNDLAERLKVLELILEKGNEFKVEIFIKEL